MRGQEGTGIGVRLFVGGRTKAGRPFCPGDMGMGEKVNFPGREGGSGFDKWERNKETDRGLS